MTFDPSVEEKKAAVLLAAVLINIITDRNVFSEMKKDDCKPQARLADNVKDKILYKAGWRKFTGTDP